MGEGSAGRFDWERAIRHADLRPPMVKCVALMLATYANADGTNAHPSEDRLAGDIGISARAVRDYLDLLRRTGLIERTFGGSTGGRRKLADCYSLALPADARARVTAEMERRDALALAKKSRSEHRKPASGAAAEPEGSMTGSLLPDHRKQSADHRKQDPRSTGSTLPPTITDTKDVDQPSPSADHPATPATDRARVASDLGAVRIAGPARARDALRQSVTAARAEHSA